MTKAKSKKKIVKKSTPKVVKKKAPTKKPKQDEPLNDKQKLFCKYYLALSFNGTQAAINAGYSPKTARSIASALLTKINIQAFLAIEKDKVFEKADITKERTLAEIGRIAFSNIKNLYDSNGALKNIKDIDPETSACISGIEVLEEFDGRGEDRIHIGNTVKVKLWGKDRGLEMLAKHFNLYTDAPVINNNPAPETLDLTQFTDDELRTIAELQRKGGIGKEKHA